MDKEHLDTKQLSNLINKKSGVLGISGISSDMRDIDAAIAEGNERAKLALDMYIYRIIKYIGAYTASAQRRGHNSVYRRSGREPAAFAQGRV